MAKKNLGIIFGGKSSEHEVSLRSATTVINCASREKYNITLIGITKKGEWHLYEGDVSLIATGEWETSGKCRRAFIAPDPTIKGMVVMNDNAPCEIIPLDVVYPVLHGKNGEDGTMQGLLELACIPYVGCDTPSSAICMDKALTNTILEFGGVPQPHFVWFYMDSFKKDMDSIISRIEDYLGYPCFVKPANAGSSVGISKCTSQSELLDAIRYAAVHDNKIVVEQGVVGQEVEIAVLGNEDAQASVVGEILTAGEWYDYDAKYSDIGSQTRIPADLPADTAQALRETAVRAYKLLGCSGLARVDFFVRASDGQILLNEPNTLPGFTSISMYPQLWEACGVSNSELIDKLVEYAEKRMSKRI